MLRPSTVGTAAPGASVTDEACLNRLNEPTAAADPRRKARRAL
jgi:hypothetical protein